MKNKLISFLIISISVWSMDTPCSGAGASIILSQPLEKICKQMEGELELHFNPVTRSEISKRKKASYQGRKFFSDVKTILSIYFHELDKLKLNKKFNEFEAQDFFKDTYDEIKTITREVNFIEFQIIVLNRSDRSSFEGIYEKIYAKAKPTILSFIEKIKLLNIGSYHEDSEPFINTDRVELERYNVILHEAAGRFIDSSLSVTAYNVEQAQFFSSLENLEETRSFLFDHEEKLKKLRFQKKLYEEYSYETIIGGYEKQFTEIKYLDKELLEEYKKIFSCIESEMKNYKCKFIPSYINDESEDKDQKLLFDETLSEILKLPESSSELFTDLDSIQKIKSEEFIQKQESFLKNSITLDNLRIDKALKAQNIIMEIRKLLAKLRHASTNNHKVIQTKIEKIVDFMILNFPSIVKPECDHDVSDPQAASDILSKQKYKACKCVDVCIKEDSSQSGAAADLLDSPEATFGGAAAGLPAFLEFDESKTKEKLQYFRYFLTVYIPSDTMNIEFREHFAGLHFKSKELLKEITCGRYFEIAKFRLLEKNIDRLENILFHEDLAKKSSNQHFVPFYQTEHAHETEHVTSITAYAPDTPDIETADFKEFAAETEGSLMEYKRYLILLEANISKYDFNDTQKGVLEEAKARLDRLQFVTFIEMYREESLFTQLRDNIFYLKAIFRV